MIRQCGPLLLACVTLALGAGAATAGELGRPSLKPWHETVPEARAAEQRRAAPAEAEAPAQIHLVPAPTLLGSHARFPLPRHHRHHEPRPEPAAEAAPAAGGEPAWRRRWTPWGYQPNYHGLGGTQREIR